MAHKTQTQVLADLRREAHHYFQRSKKLHFGQRMLGMLLAMPGGLVFVLGIFTLNPLIILIGIVFTMPGVFFINPDVRYRKKAERLTMEADLLERAIKRNSTDEHGGN